MFNLNDNDDYHNNLFFEPPPLAINTFSQASITPPMSPLIYFRPLNRINFFDDPFENYEPFRNVIQTTMRIRRRRREILELEGVKELESNNENFINENNIKYNLYPLYINWKKIETKIYKWTYGWGNWCG